MDTKQIIIKEYGKLRMVHPTYGEIAKKIGVSKTYVYQVIKDYRMVKFLEQKNKIGKI